MADIPSEAVSPSSSGYRAKGQGPKHAERQDLPDSGWQAFSSEHPVYVAPQPLARPPPKGCTTAASPTSGQGRGPRKHRSSVEPQAKHQRTAQEQPIEDQANVQENPLPVRNDVEKPKALAAGEGKDTKTTVLSSLRGRPGQGRKGRAARGRGGGGRGMGASPGGRILAGKEGAQVEAAGKPPWQGAPGLPGGDKDDPYR